MEPRDRILDAALRVFTEVGSRGATTRRIAEEAGVNEVTLFRHFGSKERLLHEAFARAAEWIPVADLPEHPVDPERELTRWAEAQLRHLHQARSLIRTSMGEFEEHPQVSTAACAAPLRVAARLHAYLTRLREQGEIDTECDLNAAGAFLMGALFADAISRDIMPQRYPYPPEEAASQYVRLFLRAVGGATRSGALTDHD